MSATKTSAADKLRELLNGPEILIMPCCYDGLTARLVEDAGFPLTFMTGFGVSGAHGLPDTQARRFVAVLVFLCCSWRSNCLYLRVNCVGYVMI